MKRFLILLLLLCPSLFAQALYEPQFYEQLIYSRKPMLAEKAVPINSKTLPQVVWCIPYYLYNPDDKILNRLVMMNKEFRKTYWMLRNNGYDVAFIRVSIINISNDKLFGLHANDFELLQVVNDSIVWKTGVDLLLMEVLGEKDAFRNRLFSPKTRLERYVIFTIPNNQNIPLEQLYFRFNNVLKTSRIFSLRNELWRISR